VFTFDRLSDGIQPVEGVIGHLQVKGGHDGAIGGNNTVGGQETKGLDIGRSGGKVVHAFVEAGMGGRFDMRTGNVIIVEDLESARVAEENAQAGIGDNATISGSGRANVDATSKGA
jgi:hypothetical protein